MSDDCLLSLHNMFRAVQYCILTFATPFRLFSGFNPRAHMKVYS